MPSASISESLRHSALLKPFDRPHTLAGNRGMQVERGEDLLKGRIEKGRRAPAARSGSLGAQLSKLLAERKGSGPSSRRGKFKTGYAADPRQRAVVTVFPQSHRGDAAGKLVAHGKYLERDGAGPDGEKGQLYDRDHDGIEASARLTDWAENDPRHFRLMLAPESGVRIQDLKDFTRATMARMERDIGHKLDWMAVDHHNTDNPHVHVILRGRSRDGVEFTLARDYIRHGLRNSARDIATEVLGNRGRDDERLALERETRAEKKTRLDQLLEAELKPDKPIRIQAIGRRFEPMLRAALRNRVRELAKMGLAREEKRDRFRFEPDWTARLEGIGVGIDLRRRLGRELAPGQGRLKLYDREMGRIAGEVLEAGRRGEKGKGYVIVRDKFKRPVLANVRHRDVDGLEPGAIVAIEPKTHEGPGTRVRLDRLSETPIKSQIDAPAETELDREIVRTLAGAPNRLPNTREVRNAVSERVAWHQREGNGQRDLTGRFEFEPGALDRLKSAEFSRAEDKLVKATGKRAIDVADGLEREWRVRGFIQLQQGRFAALERNDSVALLRLSRGVSLKQGKAYSMSVANGKVKATPSLGLER
ncbi:VirD2 components [alpha proteobacterium U9-1i]|nr:VirD2 components [alpha proteobacterium U9-1i]